MTVLVTTSRMCRTLVLDFCFFSAKRALSAASQSKTLAGTGRALNGDRTVVALSGESKLETVGLGGILRLGKVSDPGGADMGAAEDGKGLGGTTGAVAGGEGILDRMLVIEAGDSRSLLSEQSDRSLLAVSGTESGVVSPDDRAGELRAMALVRKSV